MSLLKTAFIQLCLRVMPPAYFGKYFRKDLYLAIHSFIQLMYMKHLLCERQAPVCEGCNDEKEIVKK